ncbi:acyl-homoserine-lactone synthase [Nitrospirillum sp. BR 11164]|uniref:acyl-homoserine-lactone synthase n=1 Tax=Nitrospirillum sp. BR 11164 TaxID=3104324 RepID=UPI002AFFF4BA|nr:acyl-homoserine-lactone synthase [Nitrospirillum sp. BR 11164]MEA1652617.1 acyl-homoserine-lactone synthase [Nitrospirillum sp. BR 11164]
MSSLRVVNFSGPDSPELLAQAWRLRHRVFREGLGWDVASVDLLEFDGFDRKAWHCAALLGGRMVGYWRALPTTEPYLLERDFPMLLGDRPAPRSPGVWEISRFVICPDVANRRDVGRVLVQAIGAFGMARDAKRLIAVVEPAFGRFVRLCGLPVVEETAPIHVGQGHKGDIHAVIIALDVPAYAVGRPTPFPATTAGADPRAA